MMFTKRTAGRSAAPLLMLLALDGALAVEPPPEAVPALIKKPADLKFKQPSFTFVRIRHSAPANAPTYSRNAWATDYPDSDRNFSARFNKDTGLKTDPDGKVLTLNDPALKQYPFLYLVEPGRLHFS